VVIYLLVFSYLLTSVGARTGGTLEYAIDDPYIHMAVAKNYLQQGVWGITRYETTSSLSSILWPWLLVGYFKIFGITLYAPLIINLVLGLAIILLSFLCLNTRRAFLFSLAAAFLGSTLSLTFVGLEHNLHIIATLLLFLGATSEKRGVAFATLLALLSAFTTSSRYEGIAAVLVLAIFRLWRGDMKGSFLMLIGGFTPILLYGLWSLSVGWYFLPTSILTKMYNHDLRTPLGILNLLGLRGLSMGLKNPAIYSLLVFLLILLSVRAIPKEHTWKVYLAIAIAFMHSNFGNFGWFYRYEAYVVVLLLFVSIAYSNFDLRNLNLAYLLIGVLLLYPVLRRGAASLFLLPDATEEQYLQDYQMAKFLKLHYDGQPVVLNDVGHVAFYTDVRILDLWGLASKRSAQLLVERNYTWEEVSNWVENEGARIGILYGDVFSKRYFPILWEEVGYWKLLNSKAFVIGSPTVVFYAIGEDPNVLHIKLAEYCNNLMPPGVICQ